jgi:long-chain acyl-CoA synthetase
VSELEAAPPRAAGAAEASEPGGTVSSDSDVGANLAVLVRRAAERDPAHPALVAGSSQLTWGELDAAVDRAAAALRDLGLDPGDRVALQLGNTLDFPALYFGALRAGLVAVPANTGYTRPELSHLLADAGAGVLVTSSVATIEGADELRAGVPELRHIVVAAPSGPDGTLALPALLDAAPAQPGEWPVRGGEDLAVLMYTSGTSGRPRGAMLSHRALRANLDQLGAIRPAVITAADVVLLALPLFHVYGLNPGLGMLAWAGATGVLVERFDPAETLGLLARHRITNVPAAPAMYAAWAELVPERELAEAFGTVRLALSGAAPLPAGTLARYAAAGVPVYEGYGLSEAAPVLASTLVGGAAKPGSVGRPIPGVELALLDDEGQPVSDEDDDPGEIAVRGRNLFSGYWPDGTGGPDRDGWYGTGDVAYADDDGDLHLVDRRQELILVNGFNVYPAEVEAVLAAHPAVAEAAVIGVPDRRTGEGVRAFVVRVPDAELTADELLTWAGAALARFKLPGLVEFVAALPHSATGKVSKAQLRDAAAAAR